MNNYILIGKRTVKCNDIIKWGQWFESNSRRVALDQIGPWRVSTVFLGLDHQLGDGPPLLFETMVFPAGKMIETLCERYSTWEEAEEGHKKIVAELKLKHGDN